MSDYIKAAINEKILSLTIDRADKKNALDLAMYQALADAVESANDDQNIRVILIKGSGDSFCSGNDIKDFLKNPPVDDSSPVLQFVRAMIAAEKPIVAAVNGIAVGIGVTMLLHCDLVYAAEDSRFQMPFVNIGLCPEAGSTHILPALMGHQKASELLLLGKMFDVDTAIDVGIVNEKVKSAELEQTAKDVVLKIAAQPPAATRTTKRLLRAAMHEQIQTAAARENQSFIPMLDGAECKEALTAFMEKRPADFSKF
ncbi:MAG: enoyl-CoA hydratase [Gammaproteobacteria bacterium]|nr:enoyl-CoA hydratase [Gammaproteobacteria bacterium]